MDPFLLSTLSPYFLTFLSFDILNKKSFSDSFFIHFFYLTTIFIGLKSVIWLPKIGIILKSIAENTGFFIKTGFFKVFGFSLLGEVFLFRFWMFRRQLRDWFVIEKLFFELKRWSSPLIFWIFADIEIQAYICSLIDHHPCFCKKNFHLISVCLNRNSLGFFDFLCAWSLSWSCVST